MKLLSDLLKIKNISEADKITSASDLDIIDKDYQRSVADKQLRDEEQSPEDMGKWSIMKMGDKVVIKNRALTIKIDSDDAFGIFEKISLGKPAKFKTSTDSFFFKPLKRGAEYAIKSEKTDELFPNGILLTGKQIDDFMNFIAISEIHEI